MELKEIVNASKTNIRLKSKKLLEKLLLEKDNLNVAELKALKEVREYFEANREYFLQQFKAVINPLNNKVGYLNDITSFSFGKSMSFLEDVLDLDVEQWGRIDHLYNVNYLNTEKQMYRRLGDNINAYIELDRRPEPNFLFRTSHGGAQTGF